MLPFACERPESPSLPSLGDYQLLEEIARGGMGVVYRARQVSLNRIVAVKLILIGRFAEKSAIRRFKVEASAAARLCHRSIVNIHEIGEEFGQHFFSMEYVEGQNLADFMRQQPISIRQVTQLVKKIAEALQYAHEQGIIHRDLKPSNILIDCQFEPRITDFGLARDLKCEADLTITGQVLGSPNYISPEQASGKATVGATTDIYSVGAILYHLITGRPPFAAETLTATLQQVSSADPVSPHMLNPSVPRDLETICLKCLQKEPSERYTTAAALADELNRFLNDEPIHARPVSAPARIWRYCRRRPVVVGLAATVLISVFLGFAGVTWQWRRAEQKAEESRRNLYAADMIRAHDAIAFGSFGFAQDLLRKYLPRASEKDLRGWEWRYAWGQCQSDELFSFQPFELSAFSVALSKDGSLLAIGGRGPVVLWDVAKKEKVTQLGFKQTVGDLIFSAGQKEIIAGISDGRLIVWNFETGYTNTVLTNLSGIRSLALSPDGRFLAVYAHAGLTLLNVPDYTRLVTFPNTAGTDNLPGGIDFSPDSRWLAYSREGGDIILWDIVHTNEAAAFHGHEQNVTALAFSTNASILISGSRDGTVRVWGVNSRKELKRLGGFSAFVIALSLSPDDGHLAVVGAGQNIRLFETRYWQEINTLKGHNAASHSIIFTPDGRNMITAGNDGTVKLWPVSTNTHVVSQRLPGLAQLLPGAKGLCLDYTNHTFSYWNTEPLREISSNWFPFDHSEAKGISPSGKLWTAATKSGVNIFDYSTQRLLTNLPLSYTGGRGFTFSADGGLLAVRGYENLCRIWRIDPPESARAALSRAAAFQLNSNPILSLKFSPGGRLFTAAYENGSPAEIWNIKSGKKIELKIDGVWITDVAISRDNSFAATSCGSGALVLWDLASQKTIGSRGGQLGTLWSVEFSPDDIRIAGCGGDGTVRIWDRETLQEVAILKLHNERLWQLAFSDNGETLFVLGQDSFGALRLFTLRAPKI